MLLTLPLVVQGQARVRVDLFLATECPISNRYIPELNRIAGVFGERGVVFEAWFAEARLEQKALEDWQRRFQLRIPVRLDVLAKEARRLGASVTPEAVVSDGVQIRYRGRIDDRYAGPGKMRQVVGQHDLVEVIEELLAGKKFPLRSRKAWGCYIEGVR
jgi:hypothetical protein